MDFNKYDLYVFDVDGTLYYQNKLRLIMGKRLLMYYLFHPLKFKDLIIIKNFRSLRENAKDTNGLFDITAKKCNVSVSRVNEVIKKWIYENPIDALIASKDDTLLAIIDKLKANGKTVAIWSDYEADDKLKALKLSTDYVYTAEQERVGELKPSPKGLNLIMSDLNVPKDKTIMIGDRMVKDGEAAKKAGCDYLILSKSKKKREEQLKTLL
ncbi:MAG: HAD-IA family hydrolase [Lachnospiraceae bacterium]|nr:HAD family hydrolase [Lachnospiraceae bacterium]MCI6978411.1 HAD family hydrolase [Lachnospiraceae bacterium]MDY3254787.1 HAD-IA family hydrolase [Lachnospiraceae bacterium]MDY5641036.1 HAD-IA family hydrolase [Lachnospiraceae bacterium]